MSLSVVIPTSNEAVKIARTVRSAHALGADEVIVADADSQDGTPAEAARCGARVILSERGRGRQMNAGAAVSSGDVLLFLHADNRLEPAAGEQIERGLADPRVVHGVFRQRINEPGRLYRWLEAGNAFRAQRLGMPYGDQALFVRRTAFEHVGGFPNQPLMEDVEIARQLRRLGKPLLLDGPLYVSARRWRRNGVVRQTVTNWWLLAAWRLGVSPQRLARWYYGAAGDEATADERYDTVELAPLAGSPPDPA